jgi:hypothetical protein
MSAVFCWLDAHNGAITAIATVFIAAFTIVLAWVSRRQARLIEDQVRLSRNEFFVTHRPRIIVRAFQMLNPDAGVAVAPQVIFIAHNIGDSPARIVEVRSATRVQPANARIPNDLAFPFHEDFNVTLASGQKEVFPMNGAAPFAADEPMNVFAGHSMLLCLGVVAYLDDAGTRRETGFCRRFLSDVREWDTLKDSEYEYSY